MTSAYYFPSSPIPYRVICYLPLSIIHDLKFGVNLINTPCADRSQERLDTVRLLIYQNDDESLVVCRNRCRHLGGNFVPDIEDGPEIVRCTYHGWKLNAKTLDYTNPPDCLKQKPLEVETQADGGLTILEPLQYEPWTVDSQEKQDLELGELTVSYICHACVEIQADGATLVTDPWLTGPAFGRGWWLLHEPESDAFSRVANADAIYISSAHSDHFNLPTLRRIAKMNSHVPIYVPDLKVKLFKNEYQQLGFTNINIIPFGVWQILKTKSGLSARFMILPDHRFPHRDTSILFEYKGHHILNLMNCHSPNGEYLPYAVDVLLSDFASGTSGYPSCFIDQFGEDKVLEMAQKKAHTFLKKTIKKVQLSYPALWIPFAGYFIEAGPHDGQIRRVNWKNSPETAAEALKSRFPFLQTWCPFPGGKYDVGAKMADEPSKSMTDYLKKTWNFEPYIHQFDQSLEFEPLKTIEGVKEYFRWTTFKNYDLVLHIVETSNDFSIIIREYFVDFVGPNPIFPDSLPVGRPLLRVRGRASIFRDAFIRGYSWDNLSIGFSGRFLAEPDIYHLKFWDHFNDNLPEDPPLWNGFIGDLPPNLLQTLEARDTTATGASTESMAKAFASVSV